MYGGKLIGVGDVIYVFASENEQGSGFIGRGIVTWAEALPRPLRTARHTPRVSIAVERTATATRSLGGRELRSFSEWGDGQPQTELNFKFYRQATNKIVGISKQTADFLDEYTI